MLVCLNVHVRFPKGSSKIRSDIIRLHYSLLYFVNQVGNVQYHCKNELYDLAHNAAGPYLIFGIVVYHCEIICLRLTVESIVRLAVWVVKYIICPFF